jgi:hypothetical protein
VIIILQRVRAWVRANKRVSKSNTKACPVQKSNYCGRVCRDIRFAWSTINGANGPRIWTKREKEYCTVCVGNSRSRRVGVAATDSLQVCDSLKFTIVPRGMPFRVPSENETAPRTYVMSPPPLRTFHRVTNSAIAYRKFVYVRMGRSKKASSARTDQRQTNILPYSTVSAATPKRVFP